jgi:hypothetical protein
MYWPLTAAALVAMLAAACGQNGAQLPAERAAWRLAHPVSADATIVDLLITEGACASGKTPEGRVLDPLVTYSATAISIAIEVTPLAGPETCQSNPDYPLTVRLTEPVGNRDLVGGTLPSRPGTTPTPLVTAPGVT